MKIGEKSDAHWPRPFGPTNDFQAEMLNDMRLRMANPIKPTLAT
jgi:hypothetical protein